MRVRRLRFAHVFHLIRRIVRFFVKGEGERFRLPKRRFRSPPVAGPVLKHRQEGVEKAQAEAQSIVEAAPVQEGLEAVTDDVSRTVTDPTDVASVT